MLPNHEGKRVPRVVFRIRAVGAITGAQTVPQVFINGTRIGGLEDLERWAKKAA